MKTEFATTKDAHSMNKGEFRITLLPGDGIGPEVVSAAAQVLDVISKKFDRRFHIDSCLIGGAAIRQTGTPLPEDTLRICLQSDAVLLGAVGSPELIKIPLL